MNPNLPWYQSAIVRQQIVQIVVALTALFGVNLGELDVDATLVSIFSGVAAVVAVWTMLTRIFKPAPNLSATAAAKEVELVAAKKIPPSPTGPQRGFFRPAASVLALVLALGAVATVTTLHGCANTAAAYKAADNLADTALVVSEHYAAVLHEAANLAQLPTTPAEVKDALKAADRAVKPFIVGDPATGTPGLNTLAARYQEVRSAATEAELQRAIDNAVRELAKLINAVKAARR